MRGANRRPFFGWCQEFPVTRSTYTSEDDVKNYAVCIDFKKGPSFTLTVLAPSETSASEKVRQFAGQSGYTETVRKIKVLEAA